MAGTQFRVVLVTCGKLAEARRIARACVDANLAACVNMVLNPVESIYRWKDKVEISREYLLLMKTTAKRLSELERMVRSMHGYNVPEFLVLPVASGSRKYLGWLAESVKPARKK